MCPPTQATLLELDSEIVSTISIASTSSIQEKSIPIESSQIQSTLSTIEVVEEPIVKEKELTLYDTMSAEEIHWLELQIQNEVGLFSKTYKEIIAVALYNRMTNGKHPKNAIEMLSEQGCFYNGQYAIQQVDEETKEIIRRVFSRTEQPHDADSYYNPNLAAPSSAYWFETTPYLTYLFTYSEDLNGQSFPGRFFKET